MKVEASVRQDYGRVRKRPRYREFSSTKPAFAFTLTCFRRTAKCLTLCAVAKLQTTFRITPAARNLQIELAEKLGVNQTAVVELAIRALAAQHGVAAAPPGDAHA
jgi:uncharacterized membrane protein (DUF485 family)